MKKTETTVNPKKVDILKGALYCLSEGDKIIGATKDSSKFSQIIKTHYCKESFDLSEMNNVENVRKIFKRVKDNYRGVKVEILNTDFNKDVSTHTLQALITEKFYQNVHEFTLSIIIEY